jgi:ABC-type polysaccharide/polyol phosphate transport system ATPase subunit
MTAGMHRLIARNIRVEYPIYDTQGRSLKNRILFDKLPFRSTQSVGGRILSSGPGGKVTILALEDVSFAMETGDRVGLLGHNGAGKSTLLKVIAGIYEPIGGELITEGRVTPMFGLSDGMDMEAVGYDNITLRCRILGLPEEDIPRVIEDVAAFSELGGYLDMPIKTYSSGMMVRLTFGIATAMHPEILIMDEMIGAGDAVFVEKAERRLKDFVDRAGILVVATHDPSTMMKWCNKALLLHQGRSVALGPVEEVMAQYAEIVQAGKTAQ